MALYHRHLWPRLALLVCILALAGSGCDTIPSDFHHTFVTIQERGVLYAGGAENPPWVEFEDGQVTGVEVDLVDRLAETMGVEVRWEEANEDELIADLARGQIDIAVAGFTRLSPWNRYARRPFRPAYTRPYVSWEGKKHVMFVRKGENRWLTHLDRFLADRGPEIRRVLDSENLELTDVEDE